jgi:hypothetical protein
MVGMRDKVVLIERGSRVEADVECEGDNCLLMLGPLDDMLLRRTATIYCDKKDIEELLKECIEVLVKLLDKYQQQGKQSK